jgi:drug/metabolite transporter (DMT)-like permease
VPTKTWSVLSVVTMGAGLAVVLLAPTWTGGVAMAGYGLLILGAVGLLLSIVLSLVGPVDVAHTHHGDEFGQPVSGKVTGMNAPFIGAPAAIILDGMVERESGKTPGPPPFSPKIAVIGLVATFLIGLLVLWLGMSVRQATLNSENPSPPVQRFTTYDPANDHGATP